MNVVSDSWMSLAIAIVFGVLGTISMKLSHGLRKIKPAVFLAIFYTICFIAMTYALKYIQLSVVYAIWSGAGTVLVAAVGMIYFNESVSRKKIIYLALIVIGVIGVHLSDGIT